MPALERSCDGCRHFTASAAALEAALPGLSSLGSGHASVRSSDGQCLEHERLVTASSFCGSHADADAKGTP